MLKIKYIPERIKIKSIIFSIISKVFPVFLLISKTLFPKKAKNIEGVIIPKAKNNKFIMILTSEFREIITERNGIVHGLKEMINEKIIPNPMFDFNTGNFIGFNLSIKAKIPRITNNKPSPTLKPFWNEEVNKTERK